jgi:hypothetical protein
MKCNEIDSNNQILKQEEEKNQNQNKINPFKMNVGSQE